MPVNHNFQNEPLHLPPHKHMTILAPPSLWVNNHCKTQTLSCNTLFNPAFYNKTYLETQRMEWRLSWWFWCGDSWCCLVRLGTSVRAAQQSSAHFLQSGHVSYPSSPLSPNWSYTTVNDVKNKLFKYMYADMLITIPLTSSTLACH